MDYGFGFKFWSEIAGCEMLADWIYWLITNQMGILLPLRFAPRDQDDNFWLRALVSKLDINKMAYAFITAVISNAALFLKP